MEAKDADGNYYVAYVLGHNPAGTDRTVWGVAVEEYLRRAGVTETTASTVMANADWPEIRRLYNRLLADGKQRRTADSTPAPSLPFHTKESPP
jgi:hypothetical protein